MKFMLCVLASLMVLCLFAKVAGGAWMGNVAFTLPFVGWTLTWFLLLFLIVLFFAWKVANSK
jgi:hypothetical protein